MSFHITGMVSRKEWPVDCEAEAAVSSIAYESLQEALAAIGGWVDRGEHENIVCFYVYHENVLAWSVSPLMPDLG